jgi:hypothetical protein
MLFVELAAVSPQLIDERVVGEHPVEHCPEFLRVGVIQPGVAAKALPEQHVAVGVGDYRSAERPGFQRDHRQAFIVRRHDECGSARNNVELISIVDEADVLDRGMRWDVQNRPSNQHEGSGIGMAGGVSCEELKELRTSFVRVDAADVHDIRTGQTKLCPRACRVDGGRDF